MSIFQNSWITSRGALASAFLLGFPLAAQAQTAGDAEPAALSNAPDGDTSRERQLLVGVFSAYTPAFLGSKDYQLIAGPNIQLRYDRVFLSIQDGLGYDLVNSGGWRAGPVVGFRQQRDEDGDSPVRVAGDRTNALRGLGNVDATADVGGFLAYERGRISAKVDVRQAASGDQGMIATFGVRYTAVMPRPGGAPAIFSIGPRLSVVDSDYNQTYFGVTAAQSARSGLAPYRPGGGLLSVGLGASAIFPVSDRVSGMVLAGYDRLADDAAHSPLVRDRGSRDQATVGFGLVYRFGL